MKTSSTLCFRLKKYKGDGILKNFTEYEKTFGSPEPCVGSPNYFACNAEIPVLFRRVKTQFGSCFALHSEELATIEQRLQGEILTLSKKGTKSLTIVRLDHKIFS